MVESRSIGRAYQAHKRVAVVLFRLAPAAVGGLRAPLLAHAGIILNHIIALRAPLLAHSSVVVIKHCLLRRLALRKRVLGPPFKGGL